MKGALKAAAALAVLAVLTWTGAYLTWHIRIVGALRSLETQTGPPFPSASNRSEAHDVLDAAGCRALPYLVGALEPSKNPFFLATASAWFAWQTAPPGENVNDRVKEWAIGPEDSAAERAKKCDAIREWWRLHGQEFHQSWRLWSRAFAFKLRL